MYIVFFFGGGGEGNIYVAADFMNCISVVFSFFIVSNFHTRTRAFLLPLSDNFYSVFVLLTHRLVPNISCVFCSTVCP